MAAGVSDSARLYPDYRVSFDLYQAVGNGFEISGGFRHLAFDDAATLYLATVSKYAGNWMLTGKASVLPDDRAGNSWSYQGLARRYFGEFGTSFWSAGYTHGFSREEPRGAGDLLSVDADTVRGELSLDLTERLRFTLSGAASRQERAFTTPLWQATLTAGLLARF